MVAIKVVASPGVVGPSFDAVKPLIASSTMTTVSAVCDAVPYR
jgi:hypothetical protein